ncbi:MAG: TlyA family RNA methyltransferase [Phycisphaerae bacterium]
MSGTPEPPLLEACQKSGRRNPAVNWTRSWPQLGCLMNVRDIVKDPPGKTVEGFVSRAGSKLAAAIETFGIAVAGLTVADLGCNVGGFCDCLLQCGAARVYAIDTGYGTLAWKLRKDPRVVVMERTNAIFAALPEPVDMATIDVAWTPQEKILPAARRMLKPNGQVLTLIKPHYETPAARTQRGVLTPEQSLAALEQAAAKINALGFAIGGIVQSPLKGQGGNIEYVAWLTMA